MRLKKSMRLMGNKHEFDRITTASTLLGRRTASMMCNKSNGPRETRIGLFAVKDIQITVTQQIKSDTQIQSTSK